MPQLFFQESCTMNPASNRRFICLRALIAAVVMAGGVAAGPGTRLSAGEIGNAQRASASGCFRMIARTERVRDGACTNLGDHCSEVLWHPERRNASRR